MRVTEITSCYIGPEISPEHFISEHVFLFLAKGKIEGYDGHEKQVITSGQYCIVRKNHLARYNKQKEEEQFEKVVIAFDEPFLKRFREKRKITYREAVPGSAFVLLQQNELVPNFIRSLMPFYAGTGKIDAMFEEIKREELLLILLQTNPGLESILFDFGTPEKIDLQAYMNRNFRFNVTLERFAYLTGRSLSAFKRDFKKIFLDTPSRWLVQKRLQEAYFLISNKDRRPSDIYLELGFEDLSHFSFAFKRKYGLNPSALRLNNKR
ncbi:MAG: AraC family transcriptional regulator [Citrobacter freundii]|nr:MAG: AraC family transcriptional regulator [Citrobacter freundii]